MEKQKAIIYPFDLEFCPIVRHRNLLEEYEIIDLVAPRGFGITGVDVGFADGGTEIGMIVKDDFFKSLEKCNVVIFADSQYYEGIEEDIYQKMKITIQQKKNIVSTLEVVDNIKNELESLCLENNTYIKFINNLAFEMTPPLYKKTNIYGLNANKYKSNSNQHEKISKIETAIIFVMGITERTNKFEIQLALREKFLELGYRVSQIGSKNCCELMGFHSFPKFMSATNLSEVEKIVMFNKFVKKIETEESPELIIIGIPGGTMKVSNNYTNKFGIFAYEISEAVEPDFAILSTFYEDFIPEYFEKLSNSSKYRFGFEIDCFNMANVQLNWTETVLLKNDVYVKLDSEFINQKLKKYEKADLSIFNIFYDSHVDQIVEIAVNKLSSYAEIELI